MAQQWFYTKDGKNKIGPVSSAELQTLAKSGQLLPADMVCMEGKPKWVAAGSIKGLFPNSAPAPKAAPTPEMVPLDSPSAGGAQGDAASTVAVKGQSQRSGSNAKLLFIGGGALLGVLILGSCLVTGAIVAYHKFHGGGAKNPKGDGSKNNPLEVTAKEIGEAYAANAIAADEKYKGKTVQIEGLFDSSRNDDGKLYVGVSGHFRCHFDNNHKGQLAKLTKGQIVAIRGIFVGGGDGLSMVKCELIAAKPIRLELSASEFYREFFDDSELAEARYVGKNLQITGKITAHYFEAPAGGGGFDGNVDLDCGAKSKVGFETPVLRCRFKQTDWEQVAKTSKGQIITVRVIVNARDLHTLGGPLLNNCEFVK